ncbi:response regulator [Candidatus Lokiarchaeum ossiferum]|uniref:response regulator n=1 Tax=Candidatus Lokiarchaeum ossiferum TaxID=2951803 RepID=UPI00352C4EA5
MQDISSNQFYWLKPKLIQNLRFISSVIALLFVILGFLTNDHFRWYSLAIEVILIFPYFLKSKIRNLFGMYLGCFGISFILLVKSALDGTGAILNIISIIIIISALLRNKKFTLFLSIFSGVSIIAITFFGKLDLFPEMIPGTSLQYDNSSSIPLITLIVAALLSYYIIDFLIESILKQQEINRILKKDQEQLIISEKLASLSLLAGGIAHDFNNYLTAILGNLNLLKMDVESNQDLYELVQDAEIATNQAKELTNQLSTLSKGGHPIKKKLVSIEENIKKIVRFHLSGSNVKPSFDMNLEEWTIEADVGQFSQVIQNLTINAKQAMPDGGSLLVESHYLNLPSTNTYNVNEGNYIQVKFIDTGKGILKQNYKKIFDPHFSTKKEGLGLGLMICQKIVSAHEGIISLSSQVGKGSEFTILLPAIQSSQIFQRNEDSMIQNFAYSVLVLDDDPKILTILKKMLNRLGSTVFTTKEGKETLDLYKSLIEGDQKIDFLILDLTIPGGMGGLEVMKHLLKINPEVRVIVSSGYSKDPVLNQHVKYGFKSVLKKPYHIEELKLAINECMKN